MSYPFQDDYANRLKQVRRYLALVSRTERDTRLGGDRPLDLDRLHILRAGTFLILYNLMEASARAALQAVHDEMTAQQVSFADLRHSIRREVVKGFKRNGNADKHADMLDIPVEFVAASLDVDYHFSGNVDARLLREIAGLYGVAATTRSALTHDGKDLVTIKNSRNDLAHGDKTYDEVGRSYTAKRLVEIAIRSTSYVQDMLENFSTYLDAQGYRALPEAPGAA